MPTSERISRVVRAVLSGAALIALAGCMQMPSGGQSGVTVSRNAVTILGPRGFCVDPSATVDRDGEAFVMLGNCAAIANVPTITQPTVQAVLTAAVRENQGPALADQSAAVEAYLRSDAGRAMLSQANRADTVAILDSFNRGDVLFLRTRDESLAFAPNMSPEYWRAFFDVRGRLVSVAALGFEDPPLSSAAGLRTLEAFTRIIKSRNAQMAQQPPDSVSRAAQSFIGLPQ